MSKASGMVCDFKVLQGGSIFCSYLYKLKSHKHYPGGKEAKPRPLGRNACQTLMVTQGRRLGPQRPLREAGQEEPGRLRWQGRLWSARTSLLPGESSVSRYISWDKGAMELSEFWNKIHKKPTAPSSLGSLHWA